MNDRNKTALTHELTRAVAAWMDEKGFKPVETEVPIAAGWCADLAGVIVPTQTELINLKLIERPPGWNEMYGKKEGQKRRIWTAEQRDEWRGRRDSLQRTLTCIVEVKTSKGDYRGDRKWTAEIPADMAFVALPRGMVSEELYPENWGVLEYDGKTLRRTRTPAIASPTIEQRLEVILSIAIRRDHHTRYARWREDSRERRLRDGEEKTIRRVSQITRAMFQILRGEHGSVTEVLDRSSIGKLNHRELAQLEAMWAKCPELEADYLAVTKL